MGLQQASTFMSCQRTESLNFKVLYELHNRRDFIFKMCSLSDECSLVMCQVLVTSKLFTCIKVFNSYSSPGR